MVGHAARGCARTAVAAHRGARRRRRPIGCRGICQRFQSFEFEAMARWRRRRAVGTLFARDGPGKPKQARRSVSFAGLGFNPRIPSCKGGRLVYDSKYPASRS